MQSSEPVFGRRRVRVIRRPLALALALGLSVTPLAGSGATIIVTSSDDAGSAGTCTLRQAIAAMGAGSVAGTTCVNTGAIGFHIADVINFNATLFPSGGANTITLVDVASGALLISDATLTIDATANGQVTIRRPSGAVNGFGIMELDGGGSLTLDHLTLSNGAAGAGGAIHNGWLNRNLELINCTVRNNTGGIAGGGIFSDGPFILINSTISGNSANYGGGVYSRNNLWVTNSTLSGNVANFDGGGIYSKIDYVNVLNSTIVGNTAFQGSHSGGILNLIGTGPTVNNSIVAGNSSGDMRYLPAVGSSGNLIGGNPQLNALADNGGPTWTMLPLRASPAIDGIVCANAPATDQRGTARPQGAQCDIGAAEATLLELTSPPVIGKVFGATTIPLNGNTSLTFTVTNPNNAIGSLAGVALTGVAFTDSLPAGLQVATPNGLTNTCGGSATAIAGASSASLSGATLAAGASCTLAVDVNGTTPGVKNNSVQVTSVNGAHGGIGNTSNATLTVSPPLPPAITKGFGALTILPGGTTSLTFTLNNPNAYVPVTGIAFTDNLPAGLVVATPDGLTNTCGGTATAVAGATSASLSGATLGAGAACTMAVSVTGTTPGVKDNSVQVASAIGIGNTSNATLTVSPSLPQTIAKVFGASIIPTNGTTSLTFTLHNPNALASLSGLAFTDTMPAGLVVAAPNLLTNTCGGTVTASAGASSASLSGATLAAGASCSMVVGVTGTTPGVKNNSVQATSVDGGAGNTSNAMLTVETPLPPLIAKAFGATMIPVTGTTSLTFTLRANTGLTGIVSTGIAFTDSLPAGLVVATPNAMTNTCGGTATAVPGATSATLANASLAAGASCIVTIDVQGTTRGVKHNSVQVTSTSGGTGNTSSATLWVGVWTCMLADSVLCDGFEAQVYVLGSGIDFPQGIAVDSSGNLFIVNSSSVVNEMLAVGDYTTLLPLVSGLNTPGGVAVDVNGNVFIAESGNNVVKEVLAAGGYATVNTLGSGSGFASPVGVAVDAGGNVFVADSFNHAVKEILAPGYTTVITLGSGFIQPVGIAVDGNGNVFVSDATLNLVKEILAPGYTTVNTIGGGFNNPYGIAVDASGNVLVADLGNSAVKVILAPGYTTVIPIGYGFSFPAAVAVDANGNVFVADLANNAVKKIPAPVY